MNKYCIRYIVLSVSLICLSFSSVFSQKRILTIGDSTMANYDEEKNSGEKEMRGWAQMLPMFLKGDIKLTNAAKNGRSSKSFYLEFWNDLKQSIKPGDYVFIQFGHNDEKNKGQDDIETHPKRRGTAAWGQYQKYLGIYINDTRERGGIPVLFTPVVRRLFDESGKQIVGVGLHNLVEISGNDSTMNYPLSMRALAKEMNVPLVDMTELTEKLVEGYGPEKSKEIIYANNDNTHLKAMGGILFSQLAVNELLRQNILTDYLQPLSGLAVQPNELDFSTQFTGKSTVKSFSVVGLDLKPDDGTINIVSQKPYSVSLSEDLAFNTTISVPYKSGFLNQRVFVCFTPDKEDVYENEINISSNDNAYRQTVKIAGKGKDVKKGVRISAKWNPPLTQNPKNIENITSGIYLEGLKYVETDSANLITTTDGVWPAGDIDLNAFRYMQFSVTPSWGTLYIDTVSFDIDAIGGKDMYFTALGSTDQTFSESETFTVMESLRKNQVKYIFDNVIEVPEGKTFYFRIYPWYKTESCDKFLHLDNVAIKGFLFK